MKRAASAELSTASITVIRLIGMSKWRSRSGIVQRPTEP